MRLIDRTEFLKGFAYHAPEERFSPEEVVYLIGKVPTIDPVRHGRWIAWNGERPVWLGCFCSVCKNHADSKFAFCPNCGAKMDGGESDG